MRARPMVNIRKIQRRREVDEDGGKQAEDSGRRGRGHVERKTGKYSKTLERTEAKKESDETMEMVELAEVEVNEEEVGWRTEAETQFEEEGCDLDPKQVGQGREFASWHEATSKAGNNPTTTKWIDRATKDDGGREFVRCRLVAHCSKARRGSERPSVRGDATVGSKETSFARVAGVREKRREQGQGEVKLTFIDVKFDAQDFVELPDESKKCHKHTKLKTCLYGMRKKRLDGRMTTQRGW